MSWDWHQIEQQPGFAGAEARARNEVRPVLERVAGGSVDPGKSAKVASRFLFVPFLLFIATFMSLDFLLPHGAFWEILKFLLFPVLFFAYLAAGIFLMRGQLTKLFLEAQARLRLKAEAMTLAAAPLGITYVPSPGGAPKGLEWLAKQSWAPAALREAANTLNETGGMDGAVAAVRDTGLFIESNTYVVGNAEQKAQYNQQVSGMRRIEDGFEGERGGVSFSMFEWIESVEDAPDIYHLMIVLAAPFTLPASDQVEARAIFNPAVIERVIALSHGGKFRAVGRGQHLVFDFA